MGGKGVLSEDLVTCCNDPKGQRGFFDVADAVDLWGDEVAGFGHVLRDLGVAGVGIVEERGRKERGKVHSHKNGRQEQPNSHRGRGLAGALE